MATTKLLSAEELAEKIVERVRQHPGGVDAQSGSTLCASCVPGVAEDLRIRDNAVLEAAAKVARKSAEVWQAVRDIRALKT